MNLIEWSKLDVGDLYTFETDPTGNVYMKCGPASMCLIKDKGLKPDLSDRDNALCWWLGNVADLLNL